MGRSNLTPSSRPMNPTSERHGRFSHIDALRAFAVLLVVVAHAGLESIVPGGTGVTIFFAISGFIITYLMLTERDRTNGFRIGEFYLRRIVKIAPPLVLIILVPSVIYAAVAGSIRGAAVLSQTFFVFNWYNLGGGDGELPGSGVLWSLAVEEQFYIAFALLWLAAVRYSNSNRVLAVVTVVVVIISELLRFSLAADSGNSLRIYQGTDTRASSIGLGVLAAIAVHNAMSKGPDSGIWKRLFNTPVALLVVAAFLASLLFRDLYFRDTLRYTIQSAAACYFIAFGFFAQHGVGRTIFLSFARWRPINTIGLASYSIYLCDKCVVLGLEDPLAGLPRPLALFVLVLVPCLVGIASYRFVEVPALKLRKRLRPSSIRTSATQGSS